MKVSIVKVSGPFPTVQKEGEAPVDVWTVRFVYGDVGAGGEVWQREGIVNVIGDLNKTKVKAAIKALLEAEAPHPLDGTEFEV